MKQKFKAQLYLEVLLSFFVFSLILLGVSHILSLTTKITFYSEKNQIAQNLLNEYLNIALSFRNNWNDLKNNLSGNDHHSFAINQGDWKINEDQEETLITGNETYKRYFTIDDYTADKKSKIFTIYLTSSSTSENLQLILTEWF